MQWKSFLPSLVSASGARELRLDRPIVIVGCGRSGTTLLGNLLGKHPQVAYLNEPRDIWLLDPRTDIWTEQAPRRGGTLVLTAQDVTPRTQRALQRSFARRVHRDGKKRLVEKLPANSFRIEYVARILPNACFIHLVRNGIDVSKSIAHEAQRYDWYGHGDYKWRLLATHASSQGLAPLARLAEEDPLLRGLLEWRLSVDSIKASLSRLPQTCAITVRYEELLANPVTTYAKIEQFADLSPHPEPRVFAARTIKRRSPEASVTSLSPFALQIAGDLLAELGYL